MSAGASPWPARAVRVSLLGLLAGAALYALLLIPDAPPPAPQGAGRAPFVWNRDAFWSELEARFVRARSADHAAMATAIAEGRAAVERRLDELAAAEFPASAPVFDALEGEFFSLAPMVAAHPDHLAGFLQTFARLRRLVKRQSEHWPVDARETRVRLYRLLYGGRAAIEEVMLQAPRGQVPAQIAGDEEASQAPAAVVQGLTLRSGDLLVSRGAVAVSALIARGNDFPGNFSHIALVHIDASTHAVSVLESHIECGVAVNPIATYLHDTKRRILVLRLRADLPAVRADPLLPHRAAEQARAEARRRHIPYDFAMDYADHSKMFCCELASAAYRANGVTLWMGMSHLSTRGVITWLGALGVRQFESQEPSDLEYDPQLSVVAEWHDPEALFQDHVDNAVIDAMLEGAEQGEMLDYNRWRLPLSRVAKAYSVVKNWFGGVGPVPEGMSATTGLRAETLRIRHAAIKARLLESIEEFKAGRGYTPPYWELVALARKAKQAVTAR
jgi:hypothetical protein